MVTSFDLARDECVRLLRAGVAGRVAFAAPDGVHVVPVNYSIDGESVLLRTAAYSLLGTHARHSMVCFEIDQFDYDRHRGWSVAVRGRAEFVSDLDELDDIARAWSPRPWADGQRHLLVRIPFTEVTGRQLGGGWDPVKHLPVDRITGA